MLLDAVLLYNTVSSLSQKEQSIKLKQEGFEVSALLLVFEAMYKLLQRICWFL